MGVIETCREGRKRQKKRDKERGRKKGGEGEKCRSEREWNEEQREGEGKHN